MTSPTAAAALSIPSPVQGIRVDPSYLYGLGLGVDETIARVLDDVDLMGGNTIFLRAYNPAFGAFYDPHGYPDATVEPGYGATDFLGRFLLAAHVRGLPVVAWIPVNDYAAVWQAHPEWRQKTLAGDDYRPASTRLSVRSGFRAWLVGLVENLLQNYPDLDGIETAEAVIDELWDNSTDYHPDMTAGFVGSYDSAAWRIHRALGLTELHGLIFDAARAAGKPTFVVQTWAAAADGALMSSEAIRDGSGFDWSGILDLQPTHAVGELMFQQWRAVYGDTATFGAAWTARAAADFISRVAGRSIPLVHVEASDMGYEPSAPEFSSALLLALAAPGGGGADFYDYWLARERRLEGYAAAVYARDAACTRGSCAPGGGSSRSDCALEWKVQPPPAPAGGGIPGKTFVCRRGDPACDAGTSGLGCAIPLALCVNNHDPHLPACAPSPLASIEVLRPSAVQALRSPVDAANRAALGAVIAGLPLATPDTCSAAAAIAVPLGGSAAAPRAGSRTLRVRAKLSAGSSDGDALRLRCLP